MFRPKLFQVFPTDDYKVYLYYDNGEIKLYDCKWILKEESDVFIKIHDIAIFKKICTIMNGTLAFDISLSRDPYSCIDICPDTIYEESIKCNSDILSA